MPSIQPVPLGNLLNPRLPILPFWKLITDSSCSESHCHPRGQFIYSIEGVTKVVTSQGIFLIPSEQAFWCPPNQEHMLVFPGKVEIANLFIDPTSSVNLSSTQQVLDVSPLLKALILKAIRVGENYQPDTKEFRLMEVIVDEISELEPSPLTLPWGKDKRLQKIMSLILDKPGNTSGPEYWADLANVSPRTMARLFKREVNMTFNDWRLQVRLFFALERLYKGDSVTEISLELGYSSPSAFIAVFKKSLGKSPLGYVKKKLD